MRATRQSGSEGGGALLRSPYPYPPNIKKRISQRETRHHYRPGVSPVLFLALSMLYVMR
jgi:hypothetical protein